MVYGAIDLHMRHSQIRIVDADGRVLRDQRVPTTRERLTTAFAGVGAIRILLDRSPLAPPADEAPAGNTS